jgi:SAM-dependent methyltransferase
MSLKAILRNIRTQYRKIVYSGSKYQCPYCGFKANDFLKIGLPYKAIIENKIIGAGVRNGGCVNCDSVDRDRLLYAYFKHEIDVLKDLPEYSILHLAPEWRLSEEFLKYNYKQYICTDKFMTGYKYPAHTVDMDIMNITFPNDTFDLVICNHVLEHIPNDIGAMKELFRVLKPNGIAVLQVPISAILKDSYENPSVTTDKEREEHYGQYDHVRIYGQDYVTRLESVGFKVTRLNITEKYKKYGLIPEEDLFICTKL